MILHYKFQRLLFGPEAFQGNHTELKSIILCGYMAFALMAVGIFYFTIDTFSGVTGLIPFYAIMLATGLAVLTFIRMKQYRYGKIILMVLAIVLTFLFASNDTHRAGVYIYFIIATLMGFALFGFQDRRIAIGFTFLNILLFYFCYVLEWKVVLVSGEDLKRIYEEDYVRVSFISNFIVGSVLSGLIIHFLLEVNQISEATIMKQNAQLAKTNEELDRFVYSASHDLRAPLSSLLGLIEVAQRSPTPGEREKCLELMRGRVHNMEQFINEIIDYSRNARTAVIQEEIVLLDLVKKVVEALQFMEGAHTLQTNFDIDPALTFLSDATRLKVILNNVIGNALKYRDVTKTHQKVDVSAHKQADKVIISVTDNGIGILPEYQQRIFEMFYRASETSKGSGLGLYIVKETLDRLNGKITLKSAPGVGSTFVIELPS